MGDSITNAQYVGTFFFPTDAAMLADAISSDPDGEGAALLDDNQRSLEAFLQNQQFVTVTGRSDGAGAVDLEHGVDLSQRSVLLAQAFFDGASGSTPCTVAYVDGTVISVTGGGANDHVHATIMLGVRLDF